MHTQIPNLIWPEELVWGLLRQSFLWRVPQEQWGWWLGAGASPVNRVLRAGDWKPWQLGVGRWCSTRNGWKFVGDSSVTFYSNSPAAEFTISQPIVSCHAHMATYGYIWCLKMPCEDFSPTRTNRSLDVKTWCIWYSLIKKKKETGTLRVYHETHRFSSVGPWKSRKVIQTRSIFHGKSLETTQELMIYQLYTSMIYHDLPIQTPQFFVTTKWELNIAMEITLVNKNTSPILAMFSVNACKSHPFSIAMINYQRLTLWSTPPFCISRASLELATDAAAADAADAADAASGSGHLHLNLDCQWLNWLNPQIISFVASQFNPKFWCWNSTTSHQISTKSRSIALDIALENRLVKYH